MRTFGKPPFPSTNWAMPGISNRRRFCNCAFHLRPLESNWYFFLHSSGHVKVAAFDHRLQRRRFFYMPNLPWRRRRQRIGMGILIAQSPLRATLLTGCFLQVSAEAVAHR